MERGKIVETGPVLDVFRNPKQDITKRFVQQLTDSEDTNETIENLIEKYPDGKVIRLQFIGEAVERPVLQRLMQRSDIEVSILQGNIAQTNNGSYGSLVVHLNGEETAYPASNRRNSSRSSRAGGDCTWISYSQMLIGIKC